MKHAIIRWILEIHTGWRDFLLRLRFVYRNMVMTRGNADLIEKSTRDEPLFRHIRTWHNLVRYLFISKRKLRFIRQAASIEEREIWRGKQLVQLVNHTINS